MDGENSESLLESLEAAEIIEEAKEKAVEKAIAEEKEKQATQDEFSRIYVRLNELEELCYKNLNQISLLTEQIQAAQSTQPTMAEPPINPGAEGQGEQARKKLTFL